MFATARRHLAEIALVAACLSLLASALLFRLNYDQGQDIKHSQQDNARLLHQIQQSRIVLSKQGCRRTNNERAITRANLRQNRRNLAQIPDAGLAALGFTRQEAIDQIDKQIRQIPALDCKKLARQVAGRRVGRTRPVESGSTGGGSGAEKAPRPQHHQKAAEGESSPGGGSGSSGPERPSEPGPIGQNPPGGGGEPAPGDSPPPEQREPESPVIPHPDPGGVVQQIVDGVQHIVQQVVPPLP